MVPAPSHREGATWQGVTPQKEVAPPPSVCRALLGQTQQEAVQQGSWPTVPFIHVSHSARGRGQWSWETDQEQGPMGKTNMPNPQHDQRAEGKARRGGPVSPEPKQRSPGSP